MAFFNNLFNNLRSDRDAPALPQIGALPQVTPVPTQIGGIGSMLPMQTITLPNGQSVQIPQFDMEEVNANLLAAGITPQMPTPAVTPATPVATPTIADNDPFASVERMPNADLPVATPAPVVTTPAVQAPLFNENIFDVGSTIGQQPAVTTPVSTVGQPMPDDRIYMGGTKGFYDAENQERMRTGNSLVATPAVTTPAVTTPAVTTPAVTEPVISDIDPFLNPDGTIKMGTGFRGGPSLDFEFPPAPPVTPAPEGSMNPNLNTLQPVVEGNFFGDNTTTPAATTPAVEQPLAPYTGAGQTESPNYIPTIQRNETGMDALTQQLLFGLDGQGGFIPGAMQAAEKTFFNPDGTPRVVEEQRAGFTGDQTSGMDLARSNVGIQDPFLTGAEGAFRRGVTDIGQGIERGRGFQQRGLQELQSGIGNLQGELGGVEGIARGAAGNFGTQLGGIAGRGIGSTDRFGRRLGGVEGMARGAADVFGTQLGGIARRGIGSTDRFGRRLGESENLMRGTTGGYDQGLTSQFYNPYEDRVVQQTIDDVLEAGDKQDMAQRARDIQTGGESAFGSRARLGASERRESLGRGLAEALGGIRSRGFSEAQQTGLGEFARQRQAERLASSGLAGLSGQRLGAQQALGNQLTGLAGAQLGAQQNLSNQLSGLASSELGAQQALGSQLTGLAGAQLGAQQNLGSTLSGLAGTRFGAAQTGAGALSNMGALETQYGQNLANAQFGLGSNLQNLGAARQQAGAFDVNQLLSSGGMQQAQNQAVIDAQRANQLTAQAAPLAQYQALSPFISMAPQGSFQTSTTFAPKPSPMMAGINVGLGALGALGNMANQPRTS